MNKKILAAWAAVVFCFWTLPVYAQGIREDAVSSANVTVAGLGAGSGNIEIPLKRVVILTSGLAYYEHSGQVNGSVSFRIPFSFDAINDALKSLIINDPSSSNPTVTYQSENMLHRTLQSFQIDLSGDSRIEYILSRLRGAEVRVVSGEAQVSGRIISVENRQMFSNVAVNFEPWLLLNTQQGMMSFNINELTSIAFTDPSIERDLNRGLDLIAASRASTSRDLTVNLPGSDRRNVNISYVIPSPVWKVSYRLDLSEQNPRFQGWAIIDNDSDNDWNEVELSLVAGRPVSFIQNLYPPYYVRRPTLPLSIAGTAEALAHERSYDQSIEQSFGSAPAPAMALMKDSLVVHEEAEANVARQRAMAPTAGLGGAVMDGAAGNEAAGQFEFTIRHPVTLSRRTSAMLPLVDTSIEARSILFYNGSGRHPRLGAEITNTSAMKLPAGPITVFDGGVYAGDALIEFWNEGEKRLISFGEDLSVTAAVTDASTRAVSSVNISGGVMTINRALTFNKTYTFINSAAVSKPVIIEHSKTAQTELVSPTPSEQTTLAYRFNITLNPNRETEFSVSERRIISERITLLSQRLDILLSYSSNQEIPQNVRTALQRAVELKRAADAADAAARDVEASRNRLIADQDRIRKNLEAVGSQTQQGTDFLERLVALDREIDAMTITLENAQTNAKAAQQAFEEYINRLSL